MRLLLLMLAMSLALPARAEAPAEDPLALTAMLIRDGYWDRARAALDGVDPQSPEVDLERFHTLRGLIRLEVGDARGAAVDFRAALDQRPLPEAGAPLDPSLHLYLARALLASDDPAGAVAALDGAPESADAVAGSFLIRSEALRQLGQIEAAWASLYDGAERFPGEPAFLRQQILILIELELYQEAREQGQALLERPDAGPGDALLIAEAMRRGGALQAAAVLLEDARLRFPEEVELTVQAAAVALGRGYPRAAGGLLQSAAALDPTYALESAECFRQAGEMERALYMNGLVVDPAEKARQRLGLLLELEDYERALALGPRLERLGLLEDDQVTYGLAYASFRVGDFEGCEALLKKIQDPKVFSYATELRQAMASCGEEGACF